MAIQDKVDRFVELVQEISLEHHNKNAEVRDIICTIAYEIFKEDKGS